jgi:hypothetical protein
MATQRAKIDLLLTIFEWFRSLRVLHLLSSEYLPHVKKPVVRNGLRGAISTKIYSMGWKSNGNIEIVIAGVATRHSQQGAGQAPATRRKWAAPGGRGRALGRQ